MIWKGNGEVCSACELKVQVEGQVCCAGAIVQGVLSEGNSEKKHRMWKVHLSTEPTLGYWILVFPDTL